MYDTMMMRAEKRGARMAHMAMAAFTMLLAACSEPFTSARPSMGGVQVERPADEQGAEAHAGASTNGHVTLAWNALARDLVKKYSTGAAPAIRVYALVSVAQYQAAATAAESKELSSHPSEAAAVARASAQVLSYLYPGDSAQLNALATAVESAPARNPNEDRAAGAQIGRAIGDGIVAEAKVDRFFAPFTGTVPVCEACWRAVPTGPAFATLGQARTFYLTAGNQFRPAPPPAFGSSEFLAGLAEVRQVSDTRTAEQDSIAKFWSLQGGTVTPLGHWNIVAAALVERQHLDDRRAAEVFALVNLAGYDALVASHEAKYTYWLLRPTQADPAITLPIALPSFPSYPSNHSAISAAAATVLGALFPQHDAALQADAEEAGISRIYGGIHYRFDNVAGLELGRKVGRYVLAEDRAGRGPLAR